MQFIGQKISGDGKGRTIGFPTINLEAHLPDNSEHGVYAVWVRVDRHVWPAAMHYGDRPTLGKDAIRVEIFVMDLKSDESVLSAEEMEIEVVEKIRDVMKFSNLEELKDQIAIDVRIAWDILGKKDLGMSKL